MLHYAPLCCKAQRKVNRNFFEFQIFLYFCGEYCNTKVKLNNTNKSHNGAEKKPGQSDELYQANSVAYIEADLKINHLRILMAIILHLQGAIRFKVGRTVKRSGIPDVFLPPPGPDTRLGKVRILEIPVSDFHFGRTNGARLRECLEELRSTRIIFPTGSAYLLDIFPGLIAGYTVTPYARTIKIHLLEPMISRLLLTEEGYSHYSHSKALTLTNKYTVRLYWLICSWRNRGGFVITLDALKKLLQLNPGYDKYSNIVTRVLAPSRDELRSRFPIWFLFREYTAADGIRRIVFKIKQTLHPEEEKRLKSDANDFFFKALAQSGIRPDSLWDLLGTLETEDLKPISRKLTELLSHIRSHPEIHHPADYLRASLQAWLNNWSARYQDISE